MKQNYIPTIDPENGPKASVDTDPQAWALDDLPEGGSAWPLIWRLRNSRPLDDLRDLPAVTYEKPTGKISEGPMRLPITVTTPFAVAGGYPLGSAEASGLQVAEWEIHRVCPFCGGSFSFVVPSDRYGRPSRQRDGARIYCHRECMTAATRQRTADEATAGKVFARKVRPEEGESMVHLINQMVEVWDAVGTMARVVGLVDDRGRATADTVKDLGERLETLEGAVGRHSAMIVAQEHRIQGLEAELAQLQELAKGNRPWEHQEGPAGDGPG